jgi:drug/metabolite transporter (DMT)-like permease
MNLAIGMAIIGTVGAFGVETRLDPITIVFWRSVFGTAFLLAWCLVFGYLPDRTLSLRTLALSAAAGSCLVLSWAAFFAGIGMTSIATTTIVFHIQPFFVVLIGALFLKERVTRDQVLWMIAAFIGVALASGMGFTSGSVDRVWMLGIGVTILGALCYAITAILGKGLGAQRPEVTSLCQTIMGVLIFAPFVHFGQAIPMTSWSWLVGIGIIHTGIAWVIIYSAYPKLTTPVIGILSFVYPIVAIIIDWAIYGHPLGLAQGIGMLLIAISTLGVRLGWRIGMPSEAATKIGRG